MSKAPPYPSDLEAKGWSLDLDYERIEQSDTWAIATPEQRPWLLMLWLVSWRQVPAASLPNNHRLIAARLGMPEADFKEWADVLLSGWELYSDGRLYHKTLTEHVLRMAAKRTKDRQRVANFRAKSQHGNDAIEACNALHAHDKRVSSTPTPTPTPTPKGTNVPFGKAEHNAAQIDVPGLDMQSWSDWQEYRRKIGKPLKTASIIAAQKALAAFGGDQAAVVMQSIANGYQGLFPLKKGAMQAMRPPNKQQQLEDRADAVLAEFLAEKRGVIDV